MKGAKRLVLASHHAKFLAVAWLALLSLVPGGADAAKLRVADAASNACIAGCASQSDACKRVCPITLGVTCLSACESQAQTCRQGCQSKQ